MKAIIASLMVVGSLTVFADEEPNLLKKNVSFDGVNIEISEIFEIVGTNLKPSPNVVFKGTAGEQKVPRLRVKDVSLGSLFKVIESVADVNIEIIDESVSGGGGGADPFGGGPPTKRLTSSGVIIVSSNAPQKKKPPVGFAPVLLSPEAVEAKPDKVETEVISLVELKIPEDALIDAIKITLDAADPKLKTITSIAFHEPSKLLIISGPAKAIEMAQKTASALLPSYRELLLEKQAKSQVAQFTRSQPLKQSVPQLDFNQRRRSEYSVPGINIVPKGDFGSPREAVQPVPKSRNYNSGKRLNSSPFSSEESAAPRPAPGVTPKPINLPRR